MYYHSPFCTQKGAKLGLLGVDTLPRSLAPCSHQLVCARILITIAFIVASLEASSAKPPFRCNSVSTTGTKTPKAREFCVVPKDCSLPIGRGTNCQLLSVHGFCLF